MDKEYELKIPEEVLDEYHIYKGFMKSDFIGTYKFLKILTMLLKL